MRSGRTGQVTAGLIRSGNRCLDGERRESLRASGGQVEDGRSGELEESTLGEVSRGWRQRAMERAGNECGCREGLRSRL